MVKLSDDGNSIIIKGGQIEGPTCTLEECKSIVAQDEMDQVQLILRDIVIVITHARRTPMLVSAMDANEAMDRLLEIDTTVPSTND